MPGLYAAFDRLKEPDLHAVDDQVLSLFLLCKNGVPVVLVSFGDRLLTLAHALLLWRGVRFAFILGRGFRLDFDSLVFGGWLFRRSVFKLINGHCFLSRG